MPDRELAHKKTGGKIKPEERNEAAAEPPLIEGSHALLQFHYDRDNDCFQCPAGEILTFQRERNLQGVLYRHYRRYGCSRCSMKEQCIGPEGKRKELWIQTKHIPDLQVRSLPPHHGSKKKKTGMRSISNPLTLLMREKLATPDGKKTYARRFPSVEGVFGVMKSARNGWQFLRRTRERVQVEWSERCIAHNLARMIGFVRVNPIAADNI
jgi:hypothetical protein